MRCAFSCGRSIPSELANAPPMPPGENAMTQKMMTVMPSSVGMISTIRRTRYVSMRRPSRVPRQSRCRCWPAGTYHGIGIESWPK